MSGQNPATPSITERLAQRLLEPVTERDRKRAALHVLDWTGCAVAASRSEPARAMRSVFGRTSDLDGAFFWGALGNVLEMDDVDKRALLHPGPVVIPATLIGCDLHQADASLFLDAIVRGYEAMIRIGRAVGPGHYKFWHNTSTCGPFGAAAGLAATIPREAPKIVDALGLAGTQAAGFWQMRHEPRAMAKQLHTGRAAHAGLAAFCLADAGFVGVRSILEGPQGFFAATCGGASPDDVLDFPPGAPWAIHEVSFKPWPACRHVHAAIDAAMALRAQGVGARDIEKITVRSYRDAVVFCDKPHPDDTLSAKFSLQHSVAVALLSGPPALSDFEGKALRKPDTRALRNAITVKADAAISSRYPGRFGAAIDATLKSGTTLVVEIGDALGDPENPASELLIQDKAMALLAYGGMKKSEARKLAAAALALPRNEAKALRGYYALLKEACCA